MFVIYIFFDILWVCPKRLYILGLLYITSLGVSHCGVSFNVFFLNCTFRNVEHSVCASRFGHRRRGKSCSRCGGGLEIAWSPGDYAHCSSWHVTLFRRDSQWNTVCDGGRRLAASLALRPMSGTLCLRPNGGRRCVLGVFQRNSLRCCALRSSFCVHSSVALLSSTH